MKLLNTARFTLALLAVIGCAAEHSVVDAEPTTELASKADRGTDDDLLTFWFVDPERPMNDREQGHVFDAMDVLVDWANEGRGIRGDLAALTIARIGDGSVQLGSLSTVVGMDLWHICKDLEHAACPGGFPEEPEGWHGGQDLVDKLLEDMDGYMWGDHLYFSFGDSVDHKDLAGTLVHEVNHALNRSHCSYYVDLETHELDHTKAFIEEFRAFLTECYLATPEATVAECSDFAANAVVDRGYGFTPDLASVLPSGTDDVVELGELIVNADEDAPFGVLLPTTKNWPSEGNLCR